MKYDINSTEEMKDLASFFHWCRKRPAMYIGSLSVADLRIFLGGWNIHRTISPDGDIFAKYFFENFQSFIAGKYNEKRAIGWDSIIAEHHAYDRKQLEAFFQHLDEFQAVIDDGK